MDTAIFVKERFTANVTENGTCAVSDVVGSSALTNCEPNGSFKGTVKDVVKVPSPATEALARVVVEGLKEISTVSPAVQPLPVTVITVPGGPWVGFTVMLFAVVLGRLTRPILFPPSSVNQRLPSGPAAMY